MWYMHSLLQGAKALGEEIKLTLPDSIEIFNVNEVDTQYGMYEYFPRPISRINAMKIGNADDSSNYYTFQWSKPKPQPAEEQPGMSEIKSFPDAPKEVIDKSTPHVESVLYSREDLTYESNGKYYGNFIQSFTGACAGGPSYQFIEKGAVESMARLPSACSTGQYIIRFTLN